MRKQQSSTYKSSTKFIYRFFFHVYIRRQGLSVLLKTTFPCKEITDDLSFYNAKLNPTYFCVLQGLRSTAIPKFLVTSSRGDAGV